jgi:2-polyprenyl-3-methyl-5-hydroxy-6-metoxy-1,4-benzoquinol methylase
MTSESEATDGVTLELESIDTTLFGNLESVVHEQYHCEDGYENGSALCSQPFRNDSLWLESMLFRSKLGQLPFEMPPAGSIAVEFGCGLGQDSRNLAQLAGFSVTAIDVSADAIEQAKHYTPDEMLGYGPSKIEFVAYDAFAMPEPKQQVDFFF